MHVVVEMAVLFLPLVAIMAIGAGSRFLPGEYRLAFDPEKQKFLDQLVYRFALPAGTFLSVSRLPFAGEHLFGVLGTILVCATLLLVLGAFARWLVVRRWGKDVGATVALGAVSQNALYLGLPVINIMVGYDERLYAEGSIYSALSIPVMVTAVLLTMHWYGRKATSRSVAFRKLVTDPVLLSIALGFVVRLVGIRLPGAVVTPLQLLSAAATPLVLLVIGSRLRFRFPKKLRLPLALTVFVSSVCSPLIAFAASSLLFALPAEQVFLLTMVFGMPIALASTAFLTNAGIEDQELNVAAITATTLAILVTMPLWRLLAIGG